MKIESGKCLERILAELWTEKTAAHEETGSRATSGGIKAMAYGTRFPANGGLQLARPSFLGGARRMHTHRRLCTFGSSEAEEATVLLHLLVRREPPSGPTSLVETERIAIDRNEGHLTLRVAPD